MAKAVKKAVKKRGPKKRDPDKPQPNTREFAKQRREIIRGLLAQGYSPKYGFGRMVGDVCDERGIPWTRESVSNDLKRTMEELRRDEYVRFGKERILDILGQLLMECAQIQSGHPNVITGKVRTMARLLDQIADIEGIKAPVKAEVSVAALIGQIPASVMEKMAAAEVSEIGEILHRELGADQAQRLLSAVDVEIGDEKK